MSPQKFILSFSHKILDICDEMRDFLLVYLKTDDVTGSEEFSCWASHFSA